MPPDDPDSNDPAALLDLARRLAEGAAERLLDGLGRERSSIETKSSMTDLVTEMDQASERYIVDGILAARPADGILGEEGSSRVGSSGYRWTIDPIDGTTNYVYGHPGFAVSIAVSAPDGHTVAGAVADPLHGDVYTATLGGGAWRNGTRIRCSTETDTARALVATGFGYEPARRMRQGAVIAAIIGEIRDIRRMGAASVDLCAVASGRVDAFFERGLAPWDHAAGALVATEAGAIVGDLRGGAALGEFLLAATPALFGPLRDRLLALAADEA